MEEGPLEEVRNGPIFNAGAIHHDGRFYLFARGVRAGYRRNDGPGDRFLDYISDVLVFTSSDGRCYEFQQVLAAGSPEAVRSYEDPRVQRVSKWRHRGRLHVLHEPAHAGVRPPVARGSAPARLRGRPLLPQPQLRPRRRASRHRGQGRRDFQPTRRTRWADPPDRFEHAARPFRLARRTLGSSARILAEHLRNLERHTLIRPSEGALGVGAGAPPVASENGLLFFFHEREGDDHYTTKVALLSGETGRVRSLLPDPIMRPELTWECTGDMDNIIFVQGAVPRPDGTIYLTYGAADRCVGAASVAATELQEALHAAA